MSSDIYKSKGIVLHSLRYSDNALILHLLTEKLGRQSYMIKGVKSAKTRANKMALFQPMFLIEFEGIEPRYGTLHTMKDVQLAKLLKNTPFDARKSAISMFMAEVIYRLIKEVEQNAKLFDFVYESVVCLDDLKYGVSNFHLWFLVRLSSFLGFYPGNEYVNCSLFDIKEGVFVAETPEHRMVISKENSQLLGQLMGCTVEQLAELELGRTQRADFMSALLLYFGYHLDNIDNVKSLQILKEVF